MASNHVHMLRMRSKNDVIWGWCEISVSDVKVIKWHIRHISSSIGRRNISSANNIITSNWVFRVRESFSMQGNNQHLNTERVFNVWVIICGVPSWFIYSGNCVNKPILIEWRVIILRSTVSHNNASFIFSENYIFNIDTWLSWVDNDTSNWEGAENPGLSAAKSALEVHKRSNSWNCRVIMECHYIFLMARGIGENKSYQVRSLENIVVYLKLVLCWIIFFPMIISCNWVN